MQPLRRWVAEMMTRELACMRWCIGCSVLPSSRTHTRWRYSVWRHWLAWSHSAGSRLTSDIRIVSASIESPLNLQRWCTVRANLGCTRTFPQLFGHWSANYSTARNRSCLAGLTELTMDSRAARNSPGRLVVGQRARCRSECDLEWLTVEGTGLHTVTAEGRMQIQQLRSRL